MKKMTFLCKRLDGTVCMSTHSVECIPDWREARSQYAAGYTHVLDGVKAKKSAYKSAAAWDAWSGRL